MPTVIRPVSNLERSYIILQSVSNYSNLGFTVRYKWDELYTLNSNTNSVNTELSKKLILQVLYPTLTNLLQDLPNLSVSIRNVNSAKPLFIGLDEIDLSSVVKFVSVSSSQDLEKLLEQEHDSKFNLEDETRPLWRVIVGINKYEISRDSSGNGEDSGVDVSEKTRRPDYDFCIVFCWNHVIGDEMSAFAIQGMFLKVLKQALQEYNATPKRTTQPYLPSSKILTKNMFTKMCDPIEDLRDLQPSLLTIIKEGCTEFLLPSFLQKQLTGQYWAGDKHINDTPYYQNRVKMFSLPQRSYEKLVAVIESNNSTFQSVLNTAVLFSSYHHLLTFGEIKSRKFRNRKRAITATSNNTLKIMTPVSLRNHITPELPWSTMGNFTAEFLFSQNAKTQVPKEQSGQQYQFLGVVSHEYKDLETFFRNKSKPYPNGRGFSIMPSNLGKFPNLEFELPEEPAPEVMLPVTLKSERQSSLLDLIEEDNKNSAFSSLSGNEYYGFGNNQSNYNSDSSFSDCSSSDAGDFGSASNWEVVDMIFSQSVWSDGPAICLNAVTYENRFNFTITYQEGSVDEDKVDRLGDGIVKCLRIVAERGDSDINDIIFM
ncbi:2662_t:CDS:2 [Acaulospora colombiana]|uniref:2662_t:CDS:1 n=1 Tax=Acaulospora colombiana TaxID=27376 RepID=A0ACA9K6D4_9GLOM|nr:2662_t:CDS:2 [Acaulospora colombiana]